MIRMYHLKTKHKFHFKIKSENKYFISMKVSRVLCHRRLKILFLSIFYEKRFLMLRCSIEITAVNMLKIKPCKFRVPYA